MVDISMPRRKLDILVPTFNRPAKLQHILKSGLALKIPGAVFVVIDDGSTLSEEVLGLGLVNAQKVCAGFDPDKVIYLRNEQNLGLTISEMRYYREFCAAEYTMRVNDKDEFLNREPIINALKKLDADPMLTAVMIPLRQIDRVSSDTGLLFDYKRMSGREFITHYIRDETLQHAGGYLAARVSAIRAAGVPRSLNLRAYGLEDAFGYDIDFLFKLATTGDFDFERQPHVRRSIVAGMTERYPLTFAYCYYQYAKRAIRELRKKNFVSSETVRRYMGWWLLLISRGVVIAHQPVHETQLEDGTTRIRSHLPMPILLYLPFECLRFRVIPSKEMRGLYRLGASLIFRRWFHKVRGRWAGGKANTQHT